MNIKLKAGLQVVGFFVIAIVFGLVTRLGLDYFSNIYGERAVVNSIIITCFVAFFYFVGGILYDIRLAQLQYKEKLNEMVNK